MKMFRYLIICCLFAGAVAARKNIDISSINGKIFGGREIDITKVPYNAGLMFYGILICGGAIIDPEYILTAAHCVYRKNRNFISVHVASNYRQLYGQSIKVRHIIIHSDYVRSTAVNDIALLRLENSIIENSMAKPIKLGAMALPTGALINVTGWGTTSDNSFLSMTLRTVSLPVIDHRKCRDELSHLRPIPITAFCAGYSEGGKDTCLGDSGGPAIYYDKLVGITSWGNGCGKQNSPGVYTRVSSYVNWIQQNSGVTL